MKTATTPTAWLVGISALLHFLVDAVCVCCLYLTTWPFSIPQLVGVFMTYNVLAFLTQPLSGLCADRLRQRHWLLLVSVVLLAVAVLCAAVVASSDPSAAGMFLVATLLGIGNSLFHVWGGKQTALLTDNDIRAVGAFVSTGALGLAVGFVFYSWMLLYVLLLIIGILVALYLYCDTSAHPAVASSSREVPSATYSRLFVGLSVLTLMAVVMGRSFLGEAFSSGLEKNQMLALTIGAVSMAGKMAGGWLTYHFGIITTMAVVVVAILLCLATRQVGAPILLSGLFLVNCTMAVTLYLANVVLRGHEGLAFGLLAAALMPGYVLAML